VCCIEEEMNVDWEKYTGKKGGSLTPDHRPPGLVPVIIGTIPEVPARSWKDVEMSIGGQTFVGVSPVTLEETQTFDEIWTDIRAAWANEGIYSSEGTATVVAIKTALRVMYERILEELDARTPTDEV
jgi:hypothetical protein